LGNLIVHLLPTTSGTVVFDGTNFTQASKKEIKDKRKDIQIIFQDPFASLNPRMKVFDIIAEPLKTHKNLTKQELKKEVSSILNSVGLSPEFSNRYPHQFSGGQRQRIGIGRAIALKPKFIV